MTQPNILELAKQGDARAITSLLNRSLQPKGITAKAAKRDGILHVLLEGETPPNQPASIRCIHQGLQKLGFVDTPITIYGREQGSAEVCWQSHLDAPLVGEAPMMADSSESEPLMPPPPPPPSEPTDLGVQDNLADSPSNESWDNFDLNAADNEASTATADEATAIDEEPSAAYAASAQAWDNDFAGDDFALDSPDEPTLIVPPQPDEEMDSSSLSAEDSDSEILLSLWDDADIDEDEMVAPSGDGGEELDLWQDGGAGDPIDGNGSSTADSPGLIGEPQAKSKGSSVLPLILLAFLGVLGGAALASRMGMIRMPVLANMPVVGRLFAPADDGDGKNLAEQVPASNSPEAVDAGEQTQLASSSSKAEGATSEQDATSGESETTPAAATPFRDGVNAATQAATLAQIASSTEDWNIVAEHWSDAVNGMKAVPSDHPRYDVAQAKVSEYQRNLDYARRLANP